MNPLKCHQITKAMQEHMLVLLMEILLQCILIWIQKNLI